MRRRSCARNGIRRLKILHCPTRRGFAAWATPNSKTCSTTFTCGLRVLGPRASDGEQSGTVWVAGGGLAKCCRASAQLVSEACARGLQARVAGLQVCLLAAGSRHAQTQDCVCRPRAWLLLSHAGVVRARGAAERGDTAGVDVSCTVQSVPVLFRVCSGRR